MLSLAEYESLQETAHLLRSPVNAKRLLDSLDAIKRGKVIRKKEFHGQESTLDNAIHALRARHIILPREGYKGVYRLQHRGFALWITLYASKQTGNGDIKPPGLAAPHTSAVRD